MKNRDAVLEYQKVLDDAGTLTKDLDIVDPVSALYLENEATNESTSNKGNFISDIITKIEIVDGAEVLYSLNLTELEALHFYKTGRVPVLFPSEWASGGQRHGCLLLFGRYLWDKEYAIDLTKFKNPQLKITSNIDAIRAHGSNVGFATGTLKCSIMAKVMEGEAAPGKYLMAKELLSFTSSSSSGAEERKELPLDLVYRLLMTRHWSQSYDINEITSDLKLTADADKYIAFNRKVKQLDAEALAQFGIGTIKHDVLRSNAEHTRLIFNKEPIIAPYMTEADVQNFINLNAIWSSDMYAFNYDKDGVADATDRKHTMLESGHAIHATLPLPFGDMMKAETWFDPTAFKKLELVFTSGGNAGACAVVAEQVRPN